MRFVRGIPLALALLIAASSLRAEDEVKRFEVFEASFEAKAGQENPYTEISAEAQFTRPDGSVWTVPLFWNGDRSWKVRVSPDVEGPWTFVVRSAEPSLNGQSGGFVCLRSSSRGGIRPMTGRPYHFQYQDGTPMWWFGDTAWRAFSADMSEHLDRTSVQRYVEVRARQGFNYIHVDVTGTGGVAAGENEESPMFFDLPGEKLNAYYFREVDARLRFMNARGITVGLVLAWGRGYPSWRTFASDEARFRYTRYIAARYAAFNVIFIVAGEHGYMLDRVALWDELGRLLARTDPHERMIGIHAGPGATDSSEAFADADWCSFGDYMQKYLAPANEEATDRNRDELRAAFLATRSHGKPIVHAEYAYFQRDRDGDGRVDKQHSHTRTSFRRISWALAMTGGYFVTGFGTTYYGGWRDPHRFDVDHPAYDEAEEDLIRIKNLFTSLKWWELEVQDRLLSGPPGGYRYCLADPGGVYVVYTSGVTSSRIDLEPGSYSLRRYDTRTGEVSDIGTFTGAKSIQLDAPDAQDWVFLMERREK
ncbi:MAG: DUF4038 domain-containing protein [Bryobacteraceae bacterium]